MDREINVIAYDQGWPQKFEQEASMLKNALGDNCLAVHHIGSTAIQGLAAKPIIDIMAVVKDIEQVQVSALESLGYTVCGEQGMPFRVFCYKGEPRTHHLHIWEIGNPEIDKHLLFKDYLNNHQEDCLEYSNLKHALAGKYKNDIMMYSESKDEFIKNIVVRSGFEGLTIVRVLHPREVQAYHIIRKARIFDALPHIIYDPNHPTMHASNHYHYLMMQGVTPVAIAQVEIIDDGTAVLRALATDAEYENNGFGSYLLKLMERWVKQKSISKMLVHAAPQAEYFYRKFGYIDMEFNDVSIDPEAIDLGKLL